MDYLDENHIFSLFDYQEDIKEVIDYVIKRYPDLNGVPKQVEKLAINLLKIFKKDEILRGYALLEITDFYNQYKSYEASIIKDKNNESKIELKTYKKNVDIAKIKKKINKAIVIAGVVVVLFHIGSKVIAKEKENINLEMEVSKSISILTTEAGTIDREQGKNIVSQNTYQVSMGANGPVYAYNNGMIACDILKIALRNPDLLDVTVMDTYENMKNRLPNMEEVFHDMRLCLEDYSYFKGTYHGEIPDDLKECYDANKSIVYQKIQGNVIDFFNKDRNDKINKIAKEYDESSESKTSKDNSAFKSLSPESQKYLEKFIDECLDEKDELNKKYVGDFNNLVNETENNGFGGR